MAAPTIIRNAEITITADGINLEGLAGDIILGQTSPYSTISQGVDIANLVVAHPDSITGTATIICTLNSQARSILTTAILAQATLIIYATHTIDNQKYSFTCRATVANQDRYIIKTNEASNAILTFTLNTVLPKQVIIPV